MLGTGYLVSPGVGLLPDHPEELVFLVLDVGAVESQTLLLVLNSGAVEVWLPDNIRA